MQENQVDNAVKLLSAWAHEKYGLAELTHQQDFLAGKFENYLANHGITAEEFIQQMGQKSAVFEQELAQLCSVPESYFFRDASLFEFLKNKVLPNLIVRRQEEGQKLINIWSAGCSKGEEIYSIAILLTELLPDIQTWQIKLVGTDINEASLSVARQGVFSKFALRATSNILMHRYFSQEHNEFILDKNIVNMVSFLYGNLKESTPPMPQADIILCRNVLIYMDKLNATQIVYGFKSVLSPGGMLFLGPSDFASQYSPEYNIHLVSGVSYLTRAEKEPAIHILSEAQQKKERISFAQRLAQRSTLYKRLQDLLDDKKYSTLLNLVDEQAKQADFNISLYRFKAEALLGLGDDSTAKQVFEELVKHDSKDFKSLFFLSLLEMQSNPERAKQLLQTAITIKTIFPEAHHHLALLYFAEDEPQTALQYLKKALSCAELEEGSKKVLGSDEANMEAFAKMLREEVMHYEKRQSS